MRKIISILFCLISLTGFAQKKTTATDQFKGLDTAFARIMKDWKAAGFAVAVVKKDKVVYSKGFGYKNWELKIPVTDQTQFAIGSCTKAFTASLIGMISKENEVDIDKPVRTYLPGLNFNNDEMNDHVTLRDMMCHRTGVPRYDYSWYFFPSRSRDTLMQRMKYMAPSEPLRSKWQYNNFMFMLQGLVVEKVTKKSWEDNIREKIFEPLGMNNSNTNLIDWMKAKDLAVGYDLLHDSIMHRSDYFDISGMAPAGSINSSVSDMAKWVTLWINGGKYQEKEIIPNQFVNEAMSSQMVSRAALPAKDRPDMYMANYGFGWSLSSYRGHYRVEHGGNIDGFSASTCFFPSDSIGIVVLCNQNGSQVPAMVRNLISDRLLNLPYRDWQTLFYSPDTAAKAKAKDVKNSVVSDRKMGTTTSHSLKEYTGSYRSPGNEQFELALQNDSLFMLVPNRKLYLRHYHYDIFNLWDKDDIMDNDSTNTKGTKIMFRMNEAGNIASASMPLEGDDKPIVFTKKAVAKPMTKDSLQKFVGDYTLGGEVVNIYIKGENTLYLFVPGQPEYELIATDKNKFSLKVIEGYSLSFAENAKGEITDVTFIQPNGNFKASRVKKK